VLFSSGGLQIEIFLTVVRVDEVIVNRILENIFRCSSLLMSDCGLLLELGSSHCRNNVKCL